jgi:hypothetical protein
MRELRDLTSMAFFIGLVEEDGTRFEGLKCHEQSHASRAKYHDGFAPETLV